ncbi:MAG: hypothetical protein C0154_04070 [Mucilaginibacter sp.]|nr:MAG: hypothetical protein BGO48_00505 [Mucilaginibacter sp. 44-25]PLW90909.1 MAG: hypothetical protein C0154_04070 [Mucilaginibacter sp.]PMP66508.1 MAG: hypothetical protein C0191_00155 [Mucilaginibacter sp.]
MVIFAPMRIINFLRRTPVKGILGLLLITVLAVKSCDLFIDHYFAFSKAVSVENSTDDNHHCTGEDSFEKSTKKLYSCFGSTDLFPSFTWVTALSVHWDVYSFSIFTEPLRVVLTPPPNLA